MSGMHMLPVYYTTTNTRKRKKSKKTQSQIVAEKEHAKFLKKMGIGSRSSVGSEQRSSKPWVTGSSPVESAKSQTRSSVWSERTAHNGYVTGSNPVGSTNKISYDPSMAKKEEKVYTGTEIIGIAQMHKSNAVPVRGKKQATEVATMRRN
tara:strand:+ start:11 stop:460 length:450 start_codon:yes stop_codon:yes gene_type:complete